MVRIDTLRTSFLALVVPAFALATVACGGGNGGNDPYTSGVDPSAQQSDNAAAQGGETANATTDEQPNAVAEGSEADDKGYEAALGQEGAPLAADSTPDDPGSDGVGSSSSALGTARSTTFSSEVRREYNTLNKSTSYYSHTTYMNESTGTRRTDCSGFVGYALNRVSPDAYAKVPHPNTYKPLADDWYNYLSTRYTTASTQTTVRWRRITRAIDLKPGDIIAWLQPPSVSSENTGHVMVVNSVARNGRTGEVLIDIIDSTSAPHANDSRGTSHTGVGTGTLGLKVDSSGAPVAYYWRGGLSYNAVPTKIALGRVE